jgi:hypothetical protein
VGYEKILCTAGYRPQSAHPWAEEEYSRVQEYLAQEVTAQGGVGKLLAARDAVCMSLCWALYTRTKTAINWHLHQLSTPLGKWLTAFVLLGGRVVMYSPREVMTAVALQVNR